jgi:ribonuclease E
MPAQAAEAFRAEELAPPAPQVAIAVAPVAAPAPAPVAPPVAAMAPVEAFVLPMDSLQAVAEAAGLQWVNSDAEKIRAVQAAMASEPAPVHVPRERKPAEAVDEGPLVLVETRKDLSQFKLPFETAQGNSQPLA